MSDLTFQEHVQKSDLGAKIELLELDATSLGDTQVRYFVAVPLFQWLDGTASMTSIFWGGHEYIPWPLQTSDWEWDGKGQPPTPKVQMANVNGFFTAANIAFNDMCGALVTRRITFEDLLTDPDTTEAGIPEVYKVERKSSQDNVSIEYELANALDHESAQVPARVVMRNVCQRIYREWNPDTSTFDYTHATCPYTGTVYFTPDDVVTTDPSLDLCSFHLSGCKARFGTGKLPAYMFPGAGQTGQISSAT